MILFLDTEFTSLEEPPDLISIGLVNELGDFFYAELPPEEYRYSASPWVRENVLPLLWGGTWIVPRVKLVKRLVKWIEDQPDKCRIVTDAPEYDFELVKSILNPWPHNLAAAPIRFDSNSLGVQYRETLEIYRGAYFTLDKPDHNALNDACALRKAWQRAKLLEPFEAYAVKIGLQT